METMIVEVSVAWDAVNKTLSLDLQVVKWWSDVEKLWEILYLDDSLFFLFY